MNPPLRSLLTAAGGLLTRRRALEVVPPWVLERACHAGHLVRVLPGVYRDPALPATAAVHQRAVLAWLHGRGALSHTTALARWQLYEPAPGESVHVTVPAEARLRSRPGGPDRPAVQVHRRAGFAVEPPHAVVRAGLAVTPLNRSLVDAWPVLPATDRRVPVIRAVNERLTTPGHLETALALAPHLPGRAEFAHLLELLAAGCRSPLEIFGHQQVFTGPAMPTFRRQFPVDLGGRRVYLDVYAERERVDFELDGATVHGDRRQREIDLRRDARLAVLGILVVRFSHRRLVYETDTVRREILAILASRRP